MGRFSRQKGKVEERAVAKAKRDHGLDAERQIQQKRVTDVGDVHVSLHPRTTLPAQRLIVECKNLKKTFASTVLSALRQCEGYKQDETDIAQASIHLTGESRRVVFMFSDEFDRLIGGVVAPESDSDGAD